MSSRSFRNSSKIETVESGSGLAVAFGGSDVCGDGEISEMLNRAFRSSSQTETVMVGSGLAFAFDRSDVCGDGICGELAKNGPCMGRGIGVIRDSLKTESVVVGSGLAFAVRRRSKMVAPKKNRRDPRVYILET